jgi:hypothetical protein
MSVLAGPVPNHNLPTNVYCIAGITGMNLHGWPSTDTFIEAAKLILSSCGNLKNLEKSK